MWNWLELNRGNMGWLYLKYRDVKKPNKKHEKAFEILYDQYIERIGLTKDYVELLETMKQHAEAIFDWIVNKDTLSYTVKEELKIALDQMMKGEKSNSTFMQFVTAVEKYQGVEIDLKRISVEKFYSIVKNLENENEQHKKISHG